MKAFYEYKDKLLTITNKRLELMERALIEYSATDKHAQAIDRELGLAIGSTSYYATFCGMNRGRVRKRTTPQEHDSIIKMYQDGVRLKKIVHSTNLTHKSIYGILDKYGIPRRGR